MDLVWDKLIKASDILKSDLFDFSIGSLFFLHDDSKPFLKTNKNESLLLWVSAIHISWKSHFVI